MYSWSPKMKWENYVRNKGDFYLISRNRTLIHPIVLFADEFRFEKGVLLLLSVFLFTHFMLMCVYVCLLILFLLYNESDDKELRY